MARAPGYLLTWRTYGTWLHGEPGSVDHKHNGYGQPYAPTDPGRVAFLRERMKDPPFTLSPIARQIVDKVMRDHCARRQWQLLALAVRSNHVHVVIGEPEPPPELIVQQLKMWGTRRLREHRIIGPSQRAWAEHASTRYLFEPGSVADKVHYVLFEQDEPAPQRDEIG